MLFYILLFSYLILLASRPSASFLYIPLIMNYFSVYLRTHTQSYPQETFILGPKRTERIDTALVLSSDDFHSNFPLSCLVHILVEVFQNCYVAPYLPRVGIHWPSSNQERHLWSSVKMFQSSFRVFMYAFHPEISIFSLRISSFFPILCYPYFDTFLSTSLFHQILETLAIYSYQEINLKQ